MYITKAKHSQLDQINDFIYKTLLVDYPDQIINKYEFINDRLFWTDNLDDYNLYLLFDDGALKGFYIYYFHNEKTVEVDLFVGKFENANDYKNYLMKNFLNQFKSKFHIYSIIDRNEKRFFEEFGFEQSRNADEGFAGGEITMQKYL